MPDLIRHPHCFVMPDMIRHPGRLGDGSRVKPGMTEVVKPCAYVMSDLIRHPERFVMPDLIRHPWP